MLFTAKYLHDTFLKQNIDIPVTNKDSYLKTEPFDTFILTVETLICYVPKLGYGEREVCKAVWTR